MDTGQVMVVPRLVMRSGPRFASCVGRLVSMVAINVAYLLPESLICCAFQIGHETCKL
jgi:hypothetical protein